MDAADHELWLKVAAELGLDPNDVDLQATFSKMLKFVAESVEMMADVESRRATKRQVLAPVKNARRYAQKLRASLSALPVELFSADREFWSRLGNNLMDVDALTGDLLDFVAQSDDALEVLKNRKWPDPRAQRHDVIGAAVGFAYEELTGLESTCYTNPASDKGDDVKERTIGTFPAFIWLIADRVGITEKEASGIIEFRRTRHRSRYASVRAEVGKA